MEEIITKDGSITYYNDKFKEYYHSLSGAREEACEKYAKPAIKFIMENKLKDGSKEVNVLDFCFGLGYNSFVFIEEMRKVNKDIRINIIGIDSDMEIIEASKKMFGEIRDKYLDDKTSIFMMIGDAKKEIKKIKKGELDTGSLLADKQTISASFDVCFFDPFSPKKLPKLWTEEIFKEIYELMKDKAILMTYSCARSVRENMKKAGFIVSDGPTIGRNAPATIANKN